MSRDKTAIADAIPAPRAKIPEIDPNKVILNSNGFGWREFLVRLPETFVLDDLRLPEVWRKVQASVHSLKRHDHLYLVHHSEEWSAQAIVIDADRTQAVLAAPKVYQIGGRFDQLFQDENYAVVWLGGEFGVKRKADEVIVQRGAVTAAHAERMLFQQYPARLGA